MEPKIVRSADLDRIADAIRAKGAGKCPSLLVISKAKFRKQMMNQAYREFLRAMNEMGQL